MRLDRDTWRAIAFTVYLIIVGGMLTLIFLQSISAANDRRQLLLELNELQQQHVEDVAEHSESGQRDHDCIVKLALLLADPARDRTRAIIPPPQCALSPASAHAEDGETP